MNKITMSLIGLASLITTNCHNPPKYEAHIIEKDGHYKYVEYENSNIFTTGDSFVKYLFYDFNKNDTLDAIGVIANSGMGGRGGIVSSFINDTTTLFFKEQKETYETKYLPLIKIMKNLNNTK
jgi:hypothetical protein